MEWKWLANAVADRFNRMRTEIDLSLAYNKTPQCVGGHRRQKSMNSIFFSVAAVVGVVAIVVCTVSYFD